MRFCFGPTRWAQATLQLRWDRGCRDRKIKVHYACGHCVCCLTLCVPYACCLHTHTCSLHAAGKGCTASPDCTTKVEEKQAECARKVQEHTLKCSNRRAFIKVRYWGIMSTYTR